MIKFFRQIRQNLLTQNKLSKYLLYAVGEIVLVIIGILIALQINNWNINVKNNNLKKEILKDVYYEFVINRDKLNAITIKNQKCYKSAEELIQMFPIDISKVNLDSLGNPN